MWRKSGQLMALRFIIGSYQGLILTILLQIFFFLSFPIIINGLEGKNNFEDLDLDEQLKILNKPYVKSIKTEEGDVFDCISIHKQPAFHHPSLKNHKIQMKPSSSLKEIVTSTSPSSSIKPFEIGMIKSIGCPFNTIPIKRTQKEDLVRAKILMKSLMADSRETISRPSGFHYAIKILHSSPSQKYFGASARFDIQNPTVSEGQFSEAFLRIQNVIDNQIDSIQVGWMVNPALRGDNLSRCFTLWTSGRRGCFDLMCPGFVQVNPNISLSSYFDKYSVYGGVQIEYIYTVFQDKISGNWWLKFVDQIMGYWPKTLFTSLSSSVTEIAWGGGVYSASKEASPPMGNGHFVEEGFSKAAYIRDLQRVDESYKLEPPEKNLFQVFTDNPKCYNLGPLDEFDHPDFDFLYGGPGGNCGM